MVLFRPCLLLFHHLLFLHLLILVGLVALSVHLIWCHGGGVRSEGTLSLSLHLALVRSSSDVQMKDEADEENEDFRLGLD